MKRRPSLSQLSLFEDPTSTPSPEADVASPPAPGLDGVGDEPASFDASLAATQDASWDVGFAAPDEALVALAARMPAHVRLGTSSWAFPGWQGLVYQRTYPDAPAFTRLSLEEYARFPLFRTVGIDRSFYAPIPEAELAGYRAQLPDGFRCAMKVWSELTTYSFPLHPTLGARAGQLNPRFLDVEAFREHVSGPVQRAFGGALGAFVLEIPPPAVRPYPVVFGRALERFLTEAPRPFDYVVELRDRRMLDARHLALLAANGAGHVFNHWSRMPSIGEQVAIPGAVMGPRVVARIMLPPGTEYEARKRSFAPFDRVVSADPGMRKGVVALARACEERGFELDVIVNNKAEGCAPLTVRALAERLAGDAGR